MRHLIRAVVTFALVQAAPAVAGALPDDFVYLRDIDPTILQDIRYAQANNFTGRPLPGYDAPECVLRRAAANALKQVQAELAKAGLSLKVFDCYRPQRAMAAMNDWVRRGADERAKRFYPNLDRRKLVALGYIAARSTHASGNAIDLTLEQIPLREGKPFDPQAAYGACTGPVSERAPGDGLDMGTGYDCFDPKSASFTPGLSREQSKWRATLFKAMAARGFANYAHEWWHFSYGGGRPQDFVISKRE